MTWMVLAVAFLLYIAVIRKKIVAAVKFMLLVMSQNSRNSRASFCVFFISVNTGKEIGDQRFGSC